MFTNAVADQMNEIFFRRKQQILDIDLREGGCGAAVLATGLRNLECLGYMFRREDIERLRNSDEESVAVCLDRATRVVKTVLTNDPEYDGKLQYSPMYPGFPKQVMEVSAAELFINAMLTRLATLAPDGRIDLATVQAELSRQRHDATHSEDGVHDLECLLGEDYRERYDLFDVMQLSDVVEVCRGCTTLSEAGRKLFAVTRQAKSNPNDADRLKKYLAHFGLTFQNIQKQYE